jgi:hypothetical protein
MNMKETNQNVAKELEMKDIMEKFWGVTFALVFH